jgi:uncharacterized membrane protein YjjB (DUF3815 family)
MSKRVLVCWLLAILVGVTYNELLDVNGWAAFVSGLIFGLVGILIGKIWEEPRNG